MGGGVGSDGSDGSGDDDKCMVKERQKRWLVYDCIYIGEGRGVSPT